MLADVLEDVFEEVLVVVLDEDEVEFSETDSPLLAQAATMNRNTVKMRTA
ncbi:hypothetical protein [Paenibacillus beijingensis]|nr:hypothetical protein [Paenibacillus beijingensis]